MSAVLRWRCDICQRDAEVVEEVPRGSFAFYFPKMPGGWAHKGNLDLCSQACVVAYHQRVLVREQQKLADGV